MVISGSDRINIIEGQEASWLFECNDADFAACTPSDDGFNFSIDTGSLFGSPLLFGLNDVSVRSASRYEFSFLGKANIETEILLRFICDDSCESLIKICLDKVAQRHIVYFRPSGKAASIGRVRIEFDLGGNNSASSISISELVFTELDEVPDKRKTIAVCGVWADAENYNKFLSSLIRPDIIKDYVIASFTFTAPYMSDINVDTEIEFSNVIRTYNIAAIVIFAEMIKSQALIDKLRGIGRELNIPVVIIERRIEGTVNGLFNYARGFESIVRHVIEDHKIKDVKMIAGYRNNDYSLEREEIFKRVMNEHGYEVTDDDIIYGDFYAAKTKHVLLEKFSNGMTVPKAFICANDSMATGVCDLLRTMGLNVPGDCLVTGFDGAWCGRYHNPVITTCEPDFYKIGDTLISILNDPDITDYSSLDQVFEMDYKLVLNGSCGCVSRSRHDLEEVVNDLALAYQDYLYHDSEMGIFITRNHNIENIDSSVEDIDKALWLWPEQYFFISLTNSPDHIHALFRGSSADKHYKEIYYGMEGPFPEIDRMLQRLSGVNIILTRQIRANAKSYGYISAAMSDIPLRTEQRYEEFGTYISTMVNSVYNLTGLMEANSKIRSMSELDYLTGLYNRRGFLNLCNNTILSKDNYGKVFILFSVDMDGLKVINDTYGHAEGDRSLRILAHALTYVCGKKGFAARYGGDEFAFAIITDGNTGALTEELKHNLRDFMLKECRKLNISYTVRASIGYSTCIIGENVNLESLMHTADEEMYSNKKERKQTGRDI